MENKKVLYRDTDNKMLGGVASGLAEYMNWDVTIVRLVFAFCLFVIQGSALAYILAWIIIPTKYNSTNNFGFGKILLLIIICSLPVILLTAFFGFAFLAGLMPFLQ